MSDEIRVSIVGDASSLVAATAEASSATDKLTASLEAQAIAAKNLKDAQLQLGAAAAAGNTQAAAIISEYTAALAAATPAAAAATVANVDLAASQVAVAASADTASVAMGGSGLTRALTMMAGRVIGTEAGMGMMGMQFARVAAAAGPLGYVLAAMIPVALVAGAVVLYNKWQESIINLNEAVSASNEVESKWNDSLMTQDERLAAITGGSFAEYRKQLDDLKDKFPTLSNGMSAFNKELEQNDSFWVSIASNATVAWEATKAYASGGSVALAIGMAEASYASKNEVEIYITGIERKIHSNKDLLGVIGEVQDKVNEQANMVMNSPAGMLKENQAALHRYIEELDSLNARQQDYENGIRNNKADTFKKEQADAKTLAEAVKSNAEAQEASDAKHRDMLAEIAAAATEPAKVLTSADVKANTDAQIAEAARVRDSTKADAQDKWQTEYAFYEDQKSKANVTADELAELNVKEFREYQDSINAKRAADDTYQKAVVDAKKKAAAELLEIHKKEVDDEMKLEEAKETALAQMAKSAQDAARARIEEIKSEASLGTISKMSEQQQLRSVYQQQLGTGGNTGTVTSPIQQAITSQQQTISGLNPVTDADAYAEAQKRLTDLTLQLKNAQAQLNAEIAATGNAMQKLAPSATTFYQQLNAMNQNAATQMSHGWQTALLQTNANMASSFNQWMLYGKSFGQSMAQESAKLLANFADILIQMAARWIEMWVIKKIVNATGNATLIAQTTGAAAVTGSIEGTSARNSLEKSAASAAGKAWSALAGIPIVGPILGAIAAAATFAGIMALSVFEKGGVVPETGPALLHGGEMVLPAHLSNFVQKAAQSQTNEGGGNTVHMHYSPTINNPFDAKQHGSEMMSYMTSRLARQGISI